MLTLTQNIINPLVAGRTDFVEVREIALIPQALQAQIEALSKNPPPFFSPPQRLTQKLREGEALWALIKKIRLEKGNETAAISKFIAEMYGSECDRGSLRE